MSVDLTLSAGAVSFQSGEAPVVPAELALDVLDVRAEFDELVTVFAGCGDQRVEHRHDGPAEDVGDALVDAGVEGGGGCGVGAVHRLCAGQVLHVEQVPAYLAGDVAVA
ncbi:hypothetical protein [Streptomyces marokkonensis]|uniref:hypothetical protein n=1 Tax=Streptomyces marokkonensis TaxID=324855 RepID=UPI0031E7B468